MPNAYSTRLSKWLDNLLKPCIPTTYTTKDSFDFADHIRNQSANNTFMVSYDVVSLFTNIPLEDTINHICDLVNFDNFPISQSALRKLLLLACKNVLFSFNDALFIQFDGMAMGSNLGPTMAAFAMDLVESKIQQPPLSYKRYVDDIFALLSNENEADAFLVSLNSCHANLQFTIEKEAEGSISFLDVVVSREDSNFTTDWLCKPTNTGIYTPSGAYAPLTYKQAAMRSLFGRAKRICSSDVLYIKAVEKITSLFVSNGYAVNEIDRVRHAVENNLSQNRNNKSVFYWKLPYIREGESQLNKSIRDINRRLVDSKIRIVYRTNKTASFFHNKDRVPVGLSSNVVYKYTCQQCQHCYIGETRRHLITRINEHIQARPVPSEVYRHPHSPSEEDFKILLRTKYLRVAETIVISESKEILMNEQSSSVPLLLF